MFASKGAPAMFASKGAPVMLVLKGAMVVFELTGATAMFELNPVFLLSKGRIPAVPGFGLKKGCGAEF